MIRRHVDRAMHTALGPALARIGLWLGGCAALSLLLHALGV